MNKRALFASDVDTTAGLETPFELNLLLVLQLLDPPPR